MRRAFVAVLLALAGSVHLYASQIVPAGTLLQCTTTEHHLSSKTVDIGDPILCQVSRFSVFGHSVLPYGSYLAGTFEDYKDPGHFVGRGWMVLDFDRLVLSSNTIIPVSAKVVDVPKYPVDKEGRIHGTGHAVRDVLSWSLPILWPIDLINLPRRGPRPTLKAETRITVKIMEDVQVPDAPEATEAPVQSTQPTLMRRPSAYQVPQQSQSYYAPYQPAPVYMPAPPPPVYYYYPARVAPLYYRRQPPMYGVQYYPYFGR